MSNKKRISKKIQRIEFKRKLNFRISLDLASVDSSSLTAALARINNIFFDSVKKVEGFQERIVRACSEYHYGFDVADQVRIHGETIDFIHKVWKLSGVKDMESKRILAEMPEETRSPLLNLLIVGYELSEAYALIKDTFKF